MIKQKLLFAILIILVIGFYIITKIYGSKSNEKKGFRHPIWLKNLYNTTYKRQIWLSISLIVRIFIPPILFSNLAPINAMIINQIVLDNIDPIYLVATNSHLYDRQKYQTWDKLLDSWSYLVSLFYFEKKYLPILTPLLIYRLIGVYYWFKTYNEKVFFYFPDLYTAIYYAISFTILFKIKNKYFIIIASLLTSCLKLLHETNHL